MSTTTAASELTEAVYDILEGYTWTNQTPDVYYYWEIPGSERGPGADQPPQLYIYESIGADLVKFSADNELIDETHTVEVMIYILKEEGNPHLISEYKRDVVEAISEYYADVENNTTYVELAPVSMSDFREQASAMQSDYFVNTIEVQGRKLSQSGR